MIISASRRTDIPAFYSDWFMDKIRKGSVYRKNPYNDAVYETKLNPKDIKMIVFWTRNASYMLKKGYLKELTDLGYNYYFQHTITGYTIRSELGERLDGKTINPNKAIDNINELASIIGGNKIIWRFDPIIVCDQLKSDEIIRVYDKISLNLNKEINRNVLSFLDVYDHVGLNMKKAGFTNILDLTKEVNKDKLDHILNEITKISSRDKRKLFSCAETIDLSHHNIGHSKCIDDEYIKEVFGIKVTRSKDRGQREACGCVKSIDIGQYDTCTHGCVYCYANQKKDLAKNNYKRHDPQSRFLISDRII